MKKSGAFLTCSLLTITLAAVTILPKKSVAQNTSLLWEVSGNGLASSSYVFGTIHLLCQDDLVISDTLTSLLQTCDKLLLELDYDDPAMLLKIQKMAMLPDGENVKNLLSVEEYALIDDFFQKNVGFPLDNLAGMKPFLLMSMVLPSALECTPGSYELSLTRLAGEREIIGLESVEEQMGVIDSFNQDDMAKMLVESIENFDETKSEYAELVAVYNKNDPDALYSLMHETQDEIDIDNFYEVMIDERNKTWIGRIKNHISRYPTFIAVGAGHLGGENGLIQLLQAEGYTLTPISP